MEHIVLFGDSIFDNKAYVSGPDVVQQLGKLIPSTWKATLRAVDGSLARNVLAQTGALPPDATVLVLSAGGNNALQELFLFDQPLGTFSASLLSLATSLEQFEEEYRHTIAHLQNLQLPLVVCTIYYPQFPEPDIQRAAKPVLAVYNDVILRVALEQQLPVIDLRRICASPEDFANPIEPSLVGGAKIAQAIVRAAQRIREGGWFVLA
ncbi:MAG: SGNH/GDSL hydrolase family protein [Blastocatellia bacterium]|nr:SGNH/GDSL hydrolase family protein [Blastocatellia bacterium]